ncbi:hypothetical protein Goshw_022081 [Gossypium schwendimanii]|uniref:CCHC-type domain-containing protein n=1 Tax=Gossypium schwendimanii TaxID=34291 RepID=A0A7J9L5X1_GOSSC|nr:hypothetical protein [Gossypium schwendimanii]
MDVDFQNLSIDDREEEELEIQTDEDITISLETLSGGDYQAWDLGLYLIQFFNVKVDDLPSGFVSRSLEKSLGDLMGTYLKYYTSGTNLIVVSFSYKRIPPLCYICGLIGHSENNCRVLIEVSKAEIAHAWPEEIRLDLIGSKNCVENKYLFVPKLGKFQMPKGSCMQNVTGIDGREDELLEVGEAKNVPVVHCRVLSHPEEQTFRHSSNLR